MNKRLPAAELEQRFGAVMEQYGKVLRDAIARLCPKNLGIQFDDIEQEACLRLWRAFQSERNIADVASYIYRIAVTTTIDAVRRVKTRREEQWPVLDDNYEAEATLAAFDKGNSPDLAAEQQELIQTIDRALAGLTENRRRVVGLYLQGFTCQEMADLLGWSEPKTRNLVYRGLRELRQQLRSEGVEYEIE